MPDQPLVSIAIRTRNRAGLLRLAAESVLTQTYPNLELIISDDASTDDTPQVCNQIASADARVKIFRHEPALLMAGNGQFCLKISQGLYFGTLDDDNLYESTFVARMVSALQSSPNASFAFCDEWRIDAEGNRLLAQTEICSRHYHRTELAQGLRQDTPMLALNQAQSINASLFLRDALETAGGFRDWAGVSSDFDIFLNLASRGSLGYYVSARLTKYREHPQQATETFVRSTAIAKGAIAVLGAAQFSLPEAIRLQHKKLAVAYTSLCRTLLLNGDWEAARTAIHHAIKLKPGLKQCAIAVMLTLPPPILSGVLQHRYPLTPRVAPHMDLI